MANGQKPLPLQYYALKSVIYNPKNEHSRITCLEFSTGCIANSDGTLCVQLKNNTFLKEITKNLIDCVPGNITKYKQDHKNDNNGVILIMPC